jgi:hypothetical protein
MSAFLASIGLPEIVAALMVLALNAYVLMGGADFGGGLWDLLASGPRRDAQRALIADSIAPIWEANHVWLIVVVVVLFTGFPVAFGTLATVLHIPIALMLIGIVLRGSAFVFRSYGSRDHARRTPVARRATCALPRTAAILLSAMSPKPRAGSPCVYVCTMSFSPSFNLKQRRGSNISSKSGLLGRSLLRWSDSAIDSDSTDKICRNPSPNLFSRILPVRAIH